MDLPELTVYSHCGDGNLRFFNLSSNILATFFILSKHIPEKEFQEATKA